MRIFPNNFDNYFMASLNSGVGGFVFLVGTEKGAASIILNQKHWTCLMTSHWGLRDAIQEAVSTQSLKRGTSLEKKSAKCPHTQFTSIFNQDHILLNWVPFKFTLLHADTYRIQYISDQKTHNWLSSYFQVSKYYYVVWLLNGGAA